MFPQLRNTSRDASSASGAREKPFSTASRMLRPPAWTAHASNASTSAPPSTRSRTSGSASAGLSARARLNSSGDNETGFLETLDEIVKTGKVPAQVLLDRYHGEWGGDIDRVYKYSF